MSILSTIIEDQTTRRSSFADFLRGKTPLPSQRSFLSALQAPADRPHLIAEIKKASPSRGDIWSHAPIQEIAKAYEDSRAAAISVLTNETFFRGKLTDLTAVESVTKIPLLCKDFILFPEQIAAARLAGANAVLLMVSVLKTAPKIKELLTEAERWNLDALVETHSAAEISIAHEAGAQIIGINARSFSNLAVDTEIFQTLLPKVPTGVCRVAESGFSGANSVQAITGQAEAMLVGSYFMETQNLEQLETRVKSLLS